MSSSSTSAANSSGVVSVLDRVEPIAGANGFGWFGLRTYDARTGIVNYQNGPPIDIRGYWPCFVTPPSK